MTTDTNDTIGDIRKIVITELAPSADETLAADYPLVDNHIIDSLAILQLVELLESRYAVQIADEDLVPANFATLAAIAAMVERKVTLR